MGKFCFNITSWRSRNDVVCHRQRGCSLAATNTTKTANQQRQGPDRVGVVVPRWLKSGLYVRLCAASKISKNINDINDFGGRGGIRTHGTLAGTPVFKTGALNHSATLPFQRQQALSKREIKNDLRTGPNVDPRLQVSRKRAAGRDRGRNRIIGSDLPLPLRILRSKTAGSSPRGFAPDTGTSTACAVASGCGAVPNYDYGYGIIRPVAAGRSLGIIP